MRKKFAAAAVGLLVAGATVLATGSASSHGYTESPISRQKVCKNGGMSNCGDIVWEPQSVEGTKGFPSGGPADGSICSAGHSRFAQLDDPRGGAWPATRLSSGANHNFQWIFTASHATTDFKYYVTRDGWNPNSKITRASLDPQPFLTVPYNGQRPPFTYNHSGRLPTKSGKHVILAVWTVADTPNAFYSCSDVQF